MDLYAFTVERFIITGTRAKIHDILALGYSAQVNGDMVSPYSFRLRPSGFDNGAYNVADHLPATNQRPGLDRVVINDPTARVAFSFQLINAGNVPDGTLKGRIAATAEQFAGVAASVADSIGTADAWMAMALEVYAYIHTWAEAGCDGPVAVDQISGPRYVLDALTDNSDHLIRIDRKYPGQDPPPPSCDVSHYEVTWSLSHQREWVQVESSRVGSDPVFFASATGMGAASHYGAVHAFGVVDGFGLGLPAGPAVTHARTFRGHSWTVDTVGSFDLASGPTRPTAPVGTDRPSLPVSAVSFGDRLYVFGVRRDGSVSCLAHTVDGGSWVTRASGPDGLTTAGAVATAVLRHRLYLFARDAPTNRLLLFWTSDLGTWHSGGEVLEPAGPPPSSVAAVALRGTLHLFGVYRNPLQEGHVVIMHKSTRDGSSWSGWDVLAGGAHPADPATPDVPEPLDVTAGVFRQRIYLAARWWPTNHVAVNFSGDGTDWSGWRWPERDPDPAHPGAGPIPPDLAFRAAPALAAVGNHLYIFAPGESNNADGLNVVYAY